MLLENEHIFEPETNHESFSSSHPLSYEKVTSFLSDCSLFNQCAYWVIENELYMNEEMM